MFFLSLYKLSFSLCVHKKEKRVCTMMYSFALKKLMREKPINQRCILFIYIISIILWIDLCYINHLYKHKLLYLCSKALHWISPITLRNLNFNLTEGNFQICASFTACIGDFSCYFASHYVYICVLFNTFNVSKKVAPL